MTTETNYVLGFAFAPGLSSVLLINKTKPEWQVGMLNGVGGRIEKDETLYEAMVREFAEETGYATEQKQWIHFAALQFPSYGSVPSCWRATVHCLTAVVPDYFSPRKDNPNGEVARWRSVETAHMPNYIPNLHWLIPMALLKHRKPEWEEQGLVILI